MNEPTPDASRAAQSPPCIHTVATGKHEWNVIAHQHQAGDRFWIPHCPSCGWIDTEQLVKDANEKLQEAGADRRQPSEPLLTTDYIHATCIACGEVNQGGYEVEDGPGPFCAECWKRLETHFASPGADLRAALQLEIAELREIAKERKQHHSSQWIWGEGAIYDRCADRLARLLDGLGIKE